MKMKKILCSVLAIAMILSTMGTVVFADEVPAEAVVQLAGTETYFANISDAFTAENNPNDKQVLLLKDAEQDVVITEGNDHSFYINGHTLTGSIHVTGGVLKLYGNLAGETPVGAVSKVVSTGVEGDYPLWGSDAQVNVGNIILEATDPNGIALYVDGSKTNVQSDKAVINGDVKAADGGIINASAGTYNGTLVREGNASLTVTGGTFQEDPSAFLPTGYTANLVDGIYTITKDDVTLDDFNCVDGKYEISTKQDLINFRKLLCVTGEKNILAGTTFVLTNDIDMGNEPQPGAAGDSKRFMGVFDGQEHTIRNLKIRTDGGYAALFGNIQEGCVIKNLTLENVDVENTSGDYTGALVGFARANAVIENCHVTGLVKIAGQRSTGGIIGGGTTNISNCTIVASEGSEIKGSVQVGGVAGLLSANSKGITGSSIQGVDISANGYVGGIVGTVLSPSGGVVNNSLKDIAITSTANDTNANHCGLVVGATLIYTESDVVTFQGNNMEDVSATENGEAVNVIYSLNYGGEKQTSNNLVMPVAMIGTTEYFDFMKAVDEAADGAVIELLSDATVAEWQKFQKNLTINGNNHSVTITGFTQNTINNGYILADNKDKVLNMSYITWNVPDATKGFCVYGGIMNNVTVNGGKYAFQVNAATTFQNCAFSGQTSEVFYIKDTVGAPGTVIDGCIFNLTTKRAACLWSNEVFTNNVINGAETLPYGLTIIASGSATVTGNVFDEYSHLHFHKGSGEKGAITLTENFINGQVLNSATTAEQVENATIEKNKLSAAALAGLQELKSDVVSADIVAYIGEKGYFDLADAIAEAQEGDEVTILEGTYDATPVVEAKQGALKVADNVSIVGLGEVTLLVDPASLGFTHNSSGGTYQYYLGGNWSGKNSKLSFSNINFGMGVEDTSNTIDEFYVYAKDVTFTNCSFKDISVSPTGSGTATFDGCDFFGVTGSRSAIHSATSPNLVVKNSNFSDRGIHIAASQLDSLTVTGNTFTDIADGYTAIYFGNESWNKDWVGDYSNTVITVEGNDAAGETLVRNANPSLTLTQLNALADESKNVFASAFTDNSVEFVATIGDKGYTTLQAAIDSFDDAAGEYTIKLLRDIEEEVDITQNTNQKITITADANNKPVVTGNFEINGRSGGVTGEALTIENIAFYANGKPVNNEGTAFIYNPGKPTPLRYASNVTIQNCDFYDDGETINEKAVGIKTATGGSENWTVSNCTATGIHSLMQVKNILGLVVEDCVIDNCKSGVGINNTAIFTMTGTTMNVIDYGLRSGESGGGQPISITLEDNDITVTGEESPIIFRAGAEKAVANIVSGTYVGPAGLPVITNTTGADLDITISGGEYSAADVEAYLTDGMILTQNQYGMYTPVVDDSAEDVPASKVTDNITVSLVKASEDGTKYDIVLTADDGEEIHRFLSAEFDIQLTKTEENTLSIANVIGNSELKIEAIDPKYTDYANTADDKNVWGFHLDENANKITANEIKIGTVVLTGVGTGTLAIVDNDNNKVEAIESVENNIVKKYITTGEDANLTIPAAGTSVEVKKPTQDLTIQITFPNNIMDQEVDYQDMTVTIDGKDIETITKNLGQGGDATLSDNKYVLLIDDTLTKNHAYNIQVKGAGYRTANYRVTMTADKTVFFWNDASMTELSYEEGGTVMVKANFLAGDIAEDNIIDKYDLAAVVSYFGKYGLNTNPDLFAYNQYDLNRDGKIDSEDIAFVLASFGY